MDLTAAQLEFLSGPRAAELLAMDLPADELRAVKLLRRGCLPDEAAAVITLRALRQRAVASGRFPKEVAEELLATDKLLQQASSMRLAIWKGRRLAELLGTRNVHESRSMGVPGHSGLPVEPVKTDEQHGRDPPLADATHVQVLGTPIGGPRPNRYARATEVWDLCCGLGSDAIGLARAGSVVRGVDSDPAAVLCATHNARAAGLGSLCRFEVADVERLDLPADAVVHIDPDRRVSGRRSIELGDFSPAGPTLARIVARTRAGALKLPPGANALELQSIAAGLFEYVSEAGICKQLVAWWHHEDHVRQDMPRRRATVLTGPPEDPQATSIDAGVAPYAPIHQPGPWLIEPDPALAAAEAVDDLAAAEGLWRIAIGLPVLFGDRCVHTPMAACFEVLADVPGRNRDIAQAVRKLGGGTVEVKPRGLKMDTDRLQRQLRGRGRMPLAILWCRLGAKQRAFICRRAD